LAFVNIRRRSALFFCVCSAFSGHASASNVSVGTGFFYNPAGHLFTNKHVVSSCLPDTIRVRTLDQVWHPARILAADPRVDIAALSIDHDVKAFASFRQVAAAKSGSIPLPAGKAFSAGFSSPARHKFKLQYKWGQIQRWTNPEEFPYVDRIRMNAHPGSSGSPILDYAGLLIGIVFAGSVSADDDYDEMKSSGNGDKWTYAHNRHALLRFANEYRLQYSGWDNGERKTPDFIQDHADRITVLVVCQRWGLQVLVSPAAHPSDADSLPGTTR